MDNKLEQIAVEGIDSVGAEKVEKGLSEGYKQERSEVLGRVGDAFGGYDPSAFERLYKGLQGAGVRFPLGVDGMRKQGLEMSSKGRAVRRTFREYAKRYGISVPEDKDAYDRLVWGVGKVSSSDAEWLGDRGANLKSPLRVEHTPKKQDGVLFGGVSKGERKAGDVSLGWKREEVERYRGMDEGLLREELGDKKYKEWAGYNEKAQALEALSGLEQEAKEARIEAGKAEAEAVRKEMQKDMGGFTAMGGRGQEVYLREMYPEVYRMQERARALEEAVSQMRLAKEGSKGVVGDFLGGVGASVLDSDVWDMGVGAAHRSKEVLRVANKADRGEELTLGERNLLDAVTRREEAKRLFGDKVSAARRAGEVVGESLPLMAEMGMWAATGGAGAVASMGKGVARKLLERGVRKSVAKGVGTLARAMGEVGASYAIAGTFGSAGVEAGKQERMLGSVYGRIGSDGMFHYEGREGAEESEAVAYRKALTARAIENYSEMLGAHLPGIGGVAKKGLSRIGLGGIVKSVERFGGKLSEYGVVQAVNKFKQATQIQGTLEEYSEEVLGNILNGVFVGDVGLDSKEGGAFNLEENLQTFYGVVGMQALLLSPKVGGIGVGVVRKGVERRLSDAQARRIYGEEWDEYRRLLDGAGADKLAGVTQELLERELGSDRGEEEKRSRVSALMRYGRVVAGSDVLGTMWTLRRDEWVSPADVEAQESYVSGSEEDVSERRKTRIEAEAMSELVRERFELGEEEDIDAYFGRYGEGIGERASEMLRSGVPSELVDIYLDYENARERLRGSLDSAEGELSLAKQEFEQEQEGQVEVVEEGGEVVSPIGRVEEELADSYDTPLPEVEQEDVIGGEEVVLEGNNEEGNLVWRKEDGDTIIEGAEEYKERKDREDKAEVIREREREEEEADGLYRDEDGVVVYERSPIDATIEKLVGVSGGDKSLAQEVAEGELRKSEKLLAEYDSMEDIGGIEDPAERAKAMLRRKEEVERIRLKMSYWGDVLRAMGIGEGGVVDWGDVSHIDGIVDAVAGELMGEENVNVDWLNTVRDNLKGVLKSGISNISELRNRLLKNLGEAQTSKARAELKGTTHTPQYGKSVIRERLLQGMLERLKVREKVMEMDRGDEQADNPIVRGWREAEKVYGYETARNVQGEVIEGSYVLVEQSALKASHDPSSMGMKQTVGYPVDSEGRTLNDNDYKDKYHLVVGMAKSYDGRALDDLPVVSDGFVLSGNNRVMSGRLASEGKGDDSAYVKMLRKRVNEFGFDISDVERMKHPRVVFETRERIEPSMQNFARFNTVETKQKRAEEEQQRYYGGLREEAKVELCQWASMAGTWDALWGDVENVGRIIDVIKREGLQSEASVQSWRTKAGDVSDIGKKHIRMALRACLLSADIQGRLDKEGLRQYDQVLMGGLLPLLGVRRSWGDVVKEVASVVDLLDSARVWGERNGESDMLYCISAVVKDEQNRLKMEGNEMKDWSNLSGVLTLALVGGGSEVFNDVCTKLHKSVEDTLSGGSLFNSDEVAAFIVDMTGWLGARFEEEGKMTQTEVEGFVALLERNRAVKLVREGSGLDEEEAHLRGEVMRKGFNDMREGEVARIKQEAKAIEDWKSLRGLLAKSGIAVDVVIGGDGFNADAFSVVRGYAQGGVVHLNPRFYTTEAFVHEYAHIWNGLLRDYAPELWEEGKRLVKGSPYWDFVVNHPGYVHLLNDEDAIADEALARAIGEEGERRIEKMGVSGARLVSCLDRIWQWVLSKLGFNVGRKDLSSFIRMSLADLLSGMRMRPHGELTELILDGRNKAGVRDVVLEYNSIINGRTKMKRLGNRVQECLQDQYWSVGVLMDMVREERGKPLGEEEDYMRAQNLASSKSRAELEYAERNYLDKIVEASGALMRGCELDRAELQRYLVSKHALERNVVFAERDAKEAVDKVIASLDKALEYGLIEEEEYNRRRADVESGYDKLVEKNRLRDYSGLTELYYDEALADIQTSGIEKDLKKQEEMAGSASVLEGYARRYVRSVEERAGLVREGLTDELWDSIRGLNGWILEQEYKGGMMSEETYDNVRNMFSYYVPLRGWDGDEDLELRYRSGRRGSRAPLVKHAKGRRSLSDDPLVSLWDMAHKVVARSNDNLARQRLLRLAEGGSALLKSNKVWIEVVDRKREDGTIEVVWVERNPNVGGLFNDPEEMQEELTRFEEEMQALKKLGRAMTVNKVIKAGERLTQGQNNEHSIDVWRGGEHYKVYVMGHPRAAQAINGQLKRKNGNDILRAISWTNRQMSANFTSRNIAFTASNLSRDMIFSLFAISTKEDASYRWRHRKNVFRVLKEMPRLVYKLEHDSLGEEGLEGMFREFVMGGGETGYVEEGGKIRMRAKLKRSLELASGKPFGIKHGGGVVKAGVDGVQTVVDWIRYLNRCAEDVSRFAVYVTSREEGRSREVSVGDAKEVTVNFNRRGSRDGWLGSVAELYIFFNATVQGMNTLLQLAKKHPLRFTRNMLGLVVMGGLQPILNGVMQGLLGDDDRDWYWELPDYIRRNNIVLGVGGDKFVTIPLPPDLCKIFGLGELLSGVYMGKGEDDAGELAWGYVKDLSGMLPLDMGGYGDSSWIGLLPSSVAPLAQHALNVNYFGAPLYKDTGYNKAMPSYTKAYRGTSEALVKSSELLNSWSGGDKYKQGVLDINPGVVENYLYAYLGGVLKTVLQIEGSVESVFAGGLELRKVPIANRFVTKVDERMQSGNTSREYWDIMSDIGEYERLRKGYKHELMRERLSDEERTKYFDLLESLDRGMDEEYYGIAKAYRSEVDAVRRELKQDGISLEERERLSDIERGLKRELVDVVERLRQQKKGNKK